MLFVVLTLVVLLFCCDFVIALNDCLLAGLLIEFYCGLRLNLINLELTWVVVNCCVIVFVGVSR